MKPFRDIELRSLLDEQKKKILKKIDCLTNEEILANNIEILAENIYEEFYIAPITIYEENVIKRDVKQGKVTRYADRFFREYYGSDTVMLDGLIFKFHFPYTGDKVLFKCQASTFTWGAYPDIDIKDSEIIITIEKTLKEMEVPDSKDAVLSSLTNDVTDIKSGISYCNKDVEIFNGSLKKSIINSLKEKRQKVESFYSIASMFEVPVTRNEFAVTHVSVKRKITPISHSYNKQNYYCISDAEYEDILDAIKHNASTYERTPSSYKSLHEEDLRNILLAALNGMYQGGAMGEAFRNHGKTDISIERENRAAFVAECKMWTGKKEISNAIDQLDSYLTWRDCKTALIYFVRNKDFFKVLQSATEAIKSLESMRQVTEVDKNELKCVLTSSSNPGQLIQMRVFFFNLYS